VSSALTRRTRWLLVAGAVVLALLVNVAWVAFGPDDSGARGEVEGAVQQAWRSNGQAPRTVNCSESDGTWNCVVESARGDIVRCQVGTAATFLANPPAALRSSCRVE
jgi:hypothetical protein